MNEKKLIPVIYIKEGKVVTDSGDVNPVELCQTFSNMGADEIMIFDLSQDDKSHEEAISVIKEIARTADSPLLIGGNVKRLEDVKKYLYAGGKAVILDMDQESNVTLLKEAAARFGAEKIAAMISKQTASDVISDLKKEEASVLIIKDCYSVADAPLPVIALHEHLKEDELQSILNCENIIGVSCHFTSEGDFDFMSCKYGLKKAGIPVNTFESSIVFGEFKLNSDGLIPVIVQDYKTAEVLMLAYMNEEAFDHTLKTGRMTYYSRSRQELWEKGLTSGHFQYIKSLELDCDSDTLLAKVAQVGAACHTGEKSCFFRNLVKKEYDETNPLKVFEDVYDVILDRKEHPKEGSYTNYLFDKGIDKILKKVGEEATEIIIAAKNPDPEEIKYEISDFLYHVMVLMAEKGVTWDDITKELAGR